MRLAIMQPYFLPYIGHFSLIHATDRWVALDDVQFIRHGWIERNRVLNSADAWQYVKVPLEKHSQKTLIRDIRIRVQEPWQEKILAQLTCYRKKAPYYQQVVELLRQGWSQPTESIAHLNVNLLAAVCAYLDMPFHASIYSEMGLALEEVTHAGEWALHISKALGASTYINPQGGADLFRQEQFQEAGIELQFIAPILEPYNQRRGQFEPGLSIVDLLMFESPKDCLAHIARYRLSGSVA
jgi:hypothetical protein